MKKFLTLLFISCSLFVQAQESRFFYATMNAYDAQQLQQNYPQWISILETQHNKAAVYLSEDAIHTLHDQVLTHGPGFVFQESLEKAILSINTPYGHRGTYSFSITEEDLVYQALDLVDASRIGDHIQDLEAYGTRYHTYAQAEQSVYDLKDLWESMISDAGRTDISVRIFEHINTPMPSLILTIEGADNPEEFVVTGGHLDSTSFQGNSNAPGADDNASGIATLTEALRILLELEYVPQKTIEIMAFSAEEVGLVGSAEIAEEYADNDVNIISFVQFDMTGYKGSSNDIYISTDDYCSNNLNSFLIDLLEHYNTTGTHQLSYGYSICNYGCSDHFSFAQNGYEVAFPFESSFGQHNPNIHTASDTYAFLQNANHAAKFTKLALQYLIETAKVHQTASVDVPSAKSISFYTQDNILYYQMLSQHTLNQIAFYDLSGKLLTTVTKPEKSGEISLQHFSSGIYLGVFEMDNQQKVVKKVVVY